MAKNICSFINKSNEARLDMGVGSQNVPEFHVKLFVKGVLTRRRSFKDFKEATDSYMNMVECCNEA